MIVGRIVAGLVAVALIAVTLTAVGATPNAEDFLFEHQALTEQPWGLVALVQAYGGLVLIGIIIFVVERSLMAALIWTLPMLIFGHLWAAAWVLIRGPALAKRLREGASV
jgi:hypothetical protein